MRRILGRATLLLNITCPKRTNRVLFICRKDASHTIGVGVLSQFMSTISRRFTSEVFSPVAEIARESIEKRLIDVILRGTVCELNQLLETKEIDPNYRLESLVS